MSSSYEKVIQASKIKVGMKQTLRHVEQGKASEVFVAKNADPRMTTKVVQLCLEHGVKVNYVDSMKELGKACGIEVGAAMVAILNE